MKKMSKTVMLAAVAALAACSDSSVAPNTRAPDAPMATGGYTGALTSTDTAKFSITLDPWRSTTYYVGDGNSLYFPAGSVCDPLVSNYGVGQWDKPCSPIRSSVTVNVKAWLDGNGHARVDFLPHLRFVPSVLPSGWVNITFADFQASLNPFYNILYCPTDVSSCYDEAKFDPTLATVRNAVTGKVTRRIKHFSGYMVGAGDDSSAVDPNSMSKLPTGGHLPISSILGRP